MPHNHIGELFQRRAIIPDFATKLPLDSLGGELDRGQWIFNLMRNPPRDIAPGRHALGRNQIGHIVKGHHIPLKLGIVSAAGRHPHQQAFLFAATHQIDLLLHAIPARHAQLFEKWSKFRDRMVNIHILLCPADIQQPSR